MSHRQAECPPGPIRFDTRFEPVAFGDIDGWAEDDHAAAYGAFLASCRAIVGSAKSPRDTRPVYPALGRDLPQGAVPAERRTTRTRGNSSRRISSPARIAGRRPRTDS